MNWTFHSIVIFNQGVERTTIAGRVGSQPYSYLSDQCEFMSSVMTISIIHYLFVADSNKR